MFPTLYRSKARELAPDVLELPHYVYARETTEGDVTAGRAGAAGDFLVMRDGHLAAQWWTRPTFLESYEQVAGGELEAIRPNLIDASDSERAAAVERILEAPEAQPSSIVPPAPASSSSSSSSSSDVFASPAAAGDAFRGRVLETLHSLEELRETVSEHLASTTAQLEPLGERIAALEGELARVTELEARLSHLEGLQRFTAAQTEQRLAALEKSAAPYPLDNGDGTGIGEAVQDAHARLDQLWDDVHRPAAAPAPASSTDPNDKAPA